jgi:hypothetical protein
VQRVSCAGQEAAQREEDRAGTILAKAHGYNPKKLKIPTGFRRIATAGRIATPSSIQTSDQSFWWQQSK